MDTVFDLFILGDCGGQLVFSLSDDPLSSRHHSYCLTEDVYFFNENKSFRIPLCRSNLAVTYVYEDDADYVTIAALAHLHMKNNVLDIKLLVALLR